MNIKLSFASRIELIEVIGSLPPTTALVGASIELIKQLTPRTDEVETPGLDLKVDNNGLTWNNEVALEKIGFIEYEISDIIVDAIKKHFNGRALLDYESEIANLIFEAQIQGE